MNKLTHSLPTVGSQVMRAMRRFPERKAFVWDGGELTYAGTLDLIGRMQAVFAQRGLGRGSRLGLLMGNRAEAWCTAMAAMSSGIAITYLHPLAALNDHLYQIEDAKLDGLAIDILNHAKRGEELAEHLPRIAHLFTFGKAPYGADLVALADRVGSATPRDLARPDDIALFNYTGGTTGRSKGAMRRHASYSASTNAILADFEFPDTPRYLAIAPITHVGGTKVLPVLIRGGTVYLENGFSPTKVIRKIESERINMTLLVPTMIYTILDAPELDGADLSSLELLLYGAAPMAPSRLVEGLERIGPVFSQLYGQTEGYPLTLLRRADHDRNRQHLFASCGLPVSACDIKLLDDNGQEVPTGEIGEICARGPHVMEEYLNQPGLTEETLKDGWLRTGDVARADEQGYLYIIDRKKDMVISGGFNIYTREVEDALMLHPGVAAAAAFGIPDPKWGEAVMAAVVPRPGAQVTDEALIQFVKEHKGSMIAPKRVDFVESLPLTSLGKADKKALRSRYAAR
jgi:fatty-acyl-CoA synthase